MIRPTFIILATMLPLLIVSVSATRGATSMSVTDVETLLGDCRQPPSSAEWAYCLGLLQGVSSILSANGYLSPQARFKAPTYRRSPFVQVIQTGLQEAT